MPKMNVVIIVPLYSDCDRRIIEGAIKCARDRDDAEVYVWAHWHPRLDESCGLPPGAERELARFGVRGILADIWNATMLRRLQGIGVPVVDVGGSYPAAEVASVHVDNAAVGRLAAKHLLDRGFKSFGFWGQGRPFHASQRRRAFIGELRKAGFPCAVFNKDVAPVPWSEENEGPARRWLQSLPKPVGLMCWWDWQAIVAQYVCRQAGLAIPDEVAVMGVDNDDVWRLQCPVPLSSIETNPYNSGYKAMEVLYRMIRTGRRPSRHILLPPGNLVARRSTDTLVLDSPELVDAVRFIQDNSDKPISVGDILKAVPISRRNLEIRFKELLGRTPRQEIQHMHVERAKILMADPGLSLADIASLSGFKTHSLFSAIFKRFTKSTPGKYSKQLPRVKPALLAGGQTQPVVGRR
jgi:LacI family transcriptional regulator